MAEKYIKDADSKQESLWASAWATKSNEKNHGEAKAKLFESMRNDFHLNPDNLTDADKARLAEHLMSEAKDPKNGRYYLVENYIDAGNLDPERYREVAAEHILEFLTNSWWSKDVISNLEKLWVPNQEIRSRVIERAITIVKGASEWVRDDGTGYVSPSSVSQMKALAPVLVELGETELLNYIEALLDSQAHPYALGDFQLIRDYGPINESRGLSGITMIEVERGGRSYKLLWKNRNQFKMVPIDEYREEMFDEFVKRHGVPAERVFTKKLRDKNYPRI